MRPRLRRLLVAAQRDDTGSTLAELVVAMALMAVFGTLFTAAITLLTSGTNKVEAGTVAAAQTNAGFLTLDRTLRYASSISTPGQSASGDWYFEISQPTVSDTSTCLQYRIHDARLQQRHWTVDATQVAGPPSDWSTIASSVVNGTAASGSPDVPFAITTSSNSLYQQLTVTLRTSVTAPGTGSSTFTTTVPALNGSANRSGTVCQQMGRP